MQYKPVLVRPSVLLILGLLLLAAPAALGQIPRQKPSPGSEPAFPPAGISVNDYVIRPGEQLSLVFGVAGFPDKVAAMRSRSGRKEDDYVLFSYLSNGFSIHIDSETNRIEGILVEDRRVRLEGIPFGIGASRLEVVSRWGQPERTQNRVMAYWKRGVYVVMDGRDKVTRLMLTEPGRLDGGGGAPPPTKG